MTTFNNNASRYPSWDGTSVDRQLGQVKSPNAEDFDQLAAEVLAHQELLTLDDNAVASFTMVPAAAGANVCEVTITAKNRAGQTVAAPVSFDLFLSDSAAGTGLTGTSASGTVQPKSASGTTLQIYSAKKAFRVQSLGTGVFILEITDTGKTAFKVCASIPMNGVTQVGVTLVTGNYGS